MKVAGKVKIDTGIPLPGIGGGCSAGLPYPWEEMKVGDSFLHRSKKPTGASASANMAGNRYKRKFTVRKTPKGYRVWRIK